MPDLPICLCIPGVINLPNVKEQHTRFSPGEAKAGSALPLRHVQPASPKNIQNNAEAQAIPAQLAMILGAVR